ncbi:MAG: gliding motility-associated C-terminal domain-containing protein [Bacteroidales bacterium]|nr:gliding motility-associated C-terminal domain-containing protein [Bacteroidales bacterium]
MKTHLPISLLTLMHFEFLFLLSLYGTSMAQVNAEFHIPDTVCVNSPVTITNLTTGGSTYFWNFCSGNANKDPNATNIGNPGGLLSVPTYITLVKQENDFFSFVSCQGVGVIRYYHGASFKNNPVNWETLGTFGLLSINEEGIQIKNDNGKWIGFVCSDTRLIRLDFGASLWNTPTASVVNNIPPQNMLHGLAIVQEGINWVGFATCSLGNKLVRFNFGESLLNTPVYTDLGNIAGFNAPGAICLLFENNNWYAIIIAGYSTLARFNFGNSLLNNPVAVNLGNPGGFNISVGLTIIRDCGVTTGYWVNYQSYGEIGKLNFNGGIAGIVTGQVLGNLGQLAKPHSFSEIFRGNDTLFAYITNRENGTLTLLTFPPCNNASIPSSNLYNPTVITYYQPGVYNVRLLVNENLPTQVSICKNITVINKPGNKLVDITLCMGDSLFAEKKWQTSPGIYHDTIHYATGCDSIIVSNLNFTPKFPVDLGLDTIICNGSTILLQPEVPFAQYLWQNGSTDSIFLATAPGLYWVIVTKQMCSTRDSISIEGCTSPVWFPNVFTPNRDGINEIFHPIGQGVSKFSMMIYNRWGEQVFVSSEFSVGWDGRYRNSDASDGIYYYIATFEMDFKPNETLISRGSVTLLR